MNEYGETKSFDEILQDLVTLCKIVSGKEVELKLKMDHSLLQIFSQQFYPKEMLSRLNGPIPNIKSLTYHGGKVEFES